MMKEHTPREVGPLTHRDAAQGDGRPLAGSRDRPGRGVRQWAWVGLIAQIAFVANWAAASNWQGPRYSTAADSISDMYAMGVPGAAFLIVTFTLTGAATIAFALRSVWPSLRPGGWTAAAGSVLLVLSVGGLGDLLTATERMACRISDPGCTTARQLSNTGGRLDDILTTFGVLAMIVAGILLSFAMRRAAGWRRWARPTRAAMLLLFCATCGDIIGSSHGVGGVFERLIALTAAAWLGAVAVGVLRRTRQARAVPQGPFTGAGPGPRARRAA